MPWWGWPLLFGLLCAFVIFMTTGILLLFEAIARLGQLERLRDLR